MFMQETKVTLNTIANILGVTKVTVSKALNNQPGVSEELKKKIIQTSIEVGYKPKSSVKASKSVTKLGIMVPKRFFLDTDNFYTRIYYYMNQECAALNVTLSLYVLNPEEEKQLTLPHSFVHEMDELNGLFLAGEINEAYINSLTSHTFPIVAIDFYKPELTLDSILSDNFQAGFTVTKYLYDRGHRRIGFVGNPLYTSSVMDRYCGYMKALTAYGLEFKPHWNVVNNDEHGSYLIDFELPADMPTAFVCHCDMAAYKLLLKLQSEGISVPDQVSIISFDNTDLSKTLVPALTSMDISKQNFAKEAVHLMLWRTDNPNNSARNIYLKSKLIERDSVHFLNA